MEMDVAILTQILTELQVNEDWFLRLEEHSPPKGFSVHLHAMKFGIPRNFVSFAESPPSYAPIH